MDWLHSLSHLFRMRRIDAKTWKTEKLRSDLPLSRRRQQVVFRPAVNNHEPPTSRDPTQKTFCLFFLNRNAWWANYDKTLNLLTGCTQQAIGRLAPAQHFVTRLTEKIVERARAGGSGVIRGSVRAQFRILLLFFADISRGVDRDQNTDRKQDRYYYSQSLTHNNN